MLIIKGICNRNQGICDGQCKSDEGAGVILSENASIEFLKSKWLTLIMLSTVLTYLRNYCLDVLESGRTYL